MLRPAARKSIPAAWRPLIALAFALGLPAAGQAQSPAAPSCANPGTPPPDTVDPVADAGAFFRSRDWLAPAGNRDCESPYRLQPAVPNPADCGRVRHLPLADNRPYVQSALRPGIDAQRDNAQYRLGQARDVGGDLPTDYWQAANAYRAAASQGHAQAHWQLGTMYETGVGVPHSQQNALHHYQNSALLGSAEGRRDLQAFTAGRTYHVGADGGQLFAKSNALSGHGDQLWLLPGEPVLVFQRHPDWARVYVESANRWGWMRRSELRLAFTPPG